VEEKLLRAYRLTGGYVDWLRETGAGMIPDLSLQGDAALADRLIDLAEVVADFRARPDPDKRKPDTEATKERPTRVAKQLTRLAACLMVVLNKTDPLPDADVMGKVRKVALDTARGRTLDMARVLAAAGEAGVDARRLAAKVGMGEDRSQTLLAFLAKIKVAGWHKDPLTPGRACWRLTDRLASLWRNVVDEQH